MTDILIKIIPIFISLFSLSVTIYIFINGIKEKEQLRSPFLTIEKLSFSGDRYQFKEVYDISDNTLLQSKFTFSRRCLIDNSLDENDKNKVVPSYALVFDMRSPSSRIIDMENSVIGYEKISIKNIGYRMVSLQIISIEVIRDDGQDSQKLKPASLPCTIYLPLLENDTFDITLSLLCDNNTVSMVPFDIERLKDSEYYKQEKSIAEDNLLNTYLPYNADRWSDIIITIITENTKNEQFKQIIKVLRKNNVYYAMSENSNRIKEKAKKRIQ